MKRENHLLKRENHLLKRMNHLLIIKDIVTSELLNLIKEAKEENTQYISALLLLDMLQKRIKDNHNINIPVHNKSFESFLKIDRRSSKLAACGYSLGKSYRKQLNDVSYLIRDYHSSRWQRVYRHEIATGEQDSSNKWLYNGTHNKIDNILSIAFQRLTEEDIEAISCTSLRLHLGITQTVYRVLLEDDYFHKALLDFGIKIQVTRNPDNHEYDSGGHSTSFMLMTNYEKLLAVQKMKEERESPPEERESPPEERESITSCL